MDCFLGSVQAKLKGNQSRGIGWDFARSFACSDTLEPFGKGTLVDSHIATNDYDHVNPQCNMFGAEELLRTFPQGHFRETPFGSTEIDTWHFWTSEGLLILLGLLTLGLLCFVKKPTIFWWSNTAGTSPYVLVETRSPSSGWNLPTSYVCLPEVYCNASCNCYDCYKVRFTLSLKEATKSSIRTWRTYSHI